MISAYEHGRNAPQHCKHVLACPFDADSPEWRNGFCDESVNVNPEAVR